jgi:hypothetical protein
MDRVVSGYHLRIYLVMIVVKQEILGPPGISLGGRQDCHNY